MMCPSPRHHVPPRSCHPALGLGLNGHHLHPSALSVAVGETVIRLRSADTPPACPPAGSPLCVRARVRACCMCRRHASSTTSRGSAHTGWGPSCVGWATPRPVSARCSSSCGWTPAPRLRPLWRRPVARRGRPPLCRWADSRHCSHQNGGEPPSLCFRPRWGWSTWRRCCTASVT